VSVKGQSFTGDTTGALVNFGVGTAANIFTSGFTWMVLANTSSQNWGMGGGFSDSVGGTQEGGLLVSASGGGHLFSINDFTNGFPNSGDLADGVWRWYVITKPAGSAHYRYHYADLSTLTWVHGESNSSANQPDRAAVVAFSTWSVYALGFDSGDMAVMAGFNYTMTDQQVQDACTKILRNLYAAAGGAPKIGWSFPEKMYANGALFGDFTQGGGNETLRQLTASSADPPGFDMGIVVEADTAWATAGGGSAVGLNSPSFSCSANSLIVCEAQVDGTGGAPGGWTIGDSLGNSLNWIEIGTVQQGGSGGYVRVWSAFTTSAQSSITANVDFQTNNAKAVKVTTYLGTDPNTPPISQFAGTSATNDATPSVTNTYAGGWIAGSALDWNALGTPTTADQGKGYNVTSLISGISVRETSQRMAGGATVPLDFNAAGTSTPDWAIKMWEIVPVPLPATDSPANAPNMLSEIPPDLFMYLIDEYSNLWATSSATAQVTPETGVGAIGLAGIATATKVAAQTGNVTVGLSAIATAKKVQAQASVATVGFAPYGPTQGIRAKTGLVAVGISGTGAAVHVAKGVANATVGFAEIATAVKKAPQTGIVAVGLSAAATAKKVQAQASAATVGFSGRGTTQKIAKGVANVAVGLSGTGAENKKQAQTGAVFVGFPVYGPTQGQRLQTGRCALGLSGRALAVHLGAPAGSVTVGFTGVGTSKKTVGLVGSGMMGMSGRGAEVKRATPTGVVATGLTGTGTQKHLSAKSGAATLGLSGTSVVGKRITAGASRASFAIVGYGSVFKPTAVDHLHGATLLLAPRPVRIQVSTNAIGLKRSSGPIRIHESDTTQ